jgi:hypothetical protein
LTANGVDRFTEAPNEEVPFIGPTKCDEFRSKREKQLEGVWSKLDLAMLPVQKLSVFNPALDLFREANSCYQNGAYLATAVMCGAALESAVYLALTRNPKEGVLFLDKSYVDSQWGDILRSAKEKKIIDGGIENEINFIRNKRNYASHFAERRDKELLAITAKASVNESQVYGSLKVRRLE